METLKAHISIHESVQNGFQRQCPGFDSNMPYLVLELHDGDILNMHTIKQTREAAYRFLAEQDDGDNKSWWKVLEFHHNNIDLGAEYEVVVRVLWNDSNRVEFLGAWLAQGFAQNDGDDDYTYVDVVRCTQ